jgi:hypothetical protein
MSTYNSSSAICNSGVTASSTGSCPADWRAWWREQSRIDGCDWNALIHCAEAALARLRAPHASGSSS